VCAKSADEGFRGVLQRLRSVRSLLVVTHARPDGDGLGSMVALTRTARTAGKSARMLLPDTVPRHYQFLFADEAPGSVGEFATLLATADVIAILDTRAFAQLDGLVEALQKCRGSLLVVDHHATGDDLTDVQWVDTSAAATAVMLDELFEALDWRVDLPAAEALVTGILSDTGWLHFANTDARSLRAVTKYVERGVTMERLHETLYQSDRPERIRLMTRMLQSMELHCGGKVAVMTLYPADFSQTGAHTSETENLVNEALRVREVEASILLVQHDDFVRVSLRSRGAVDVSTVAEEFGGGGHHRASGIRSTEPLETLKRCLIQTCAEQLG
jgi:phosphoesterase RecJ-like protein